MEENQLKTLWQSYQSKLEENTALNRKNTADIAQMKVQTFVGSMKPLKFFTLLVGIVWVGFVDMLLINIYPFASLFFLISALIQVFLTKLAIGIYLYQLILIYQVDISEPILASQEKLASLRTSTLWVTRILFLQLPVWTTFYLHETMFQAENMPYLLLNGMITFTFAFFAIWLFRNIKYENKEKKWFRWLFAGKEWDPVIKSMELLDQIKEYK